MVRTQHRVTSVHFEPSRILAYSTAIAVHALALGLLLIPLSQVPIRSSAVQEPRWQISEAKPVQPPPPPLPPETLVKVTSSPAPPRQPALPTPVETAPMPVFATEAVIAPLADIAPPIANVPATEVTGTGIPLEGVQLRYRNAPAPAYPRDALMANAQGTVVLRVLVGEDGAPLEVSIERSSGHRSLDNAARNQVLRRWKFQPATDGGRPVKAYGLIPVDFKLG